LKFVWMWYQHNKGVHLGKIVSTAFIRVGSRLVKMTLTTSSHCNNLQTPCNAQTKLFSFLDVKKENAMA
jgi:hypothetical protein